MSIASNEIAGAVAAFARQPAPAASGAPEMDKTADPRVQLLRVAVASALYALQSTVGATDGDPAKGMTVVELGPQELADFATWSFWGTTHARLESIGSVPTNLDVTVGAGHESVFLSAAGTPGFVQDLARQWAGFRLYIKNVSADPQSRVRVSVW